MTSSSSKLDTLPICVVLGPGGSAADLDAKITVATLCRSLFTGTTVVLHTSNLPHFKVSRKFVEEIQLPVLNR